MLNRGRSDEKNVLDYSIGEFNKHGFIEFDEDRFQIKLAGVKNLEKNTDNDIYKSIRKFLKERSYYFNDPTEYDIDVKTGDYKVYQWYLVDGHKVFYVGFGEDDFQKNHYRKLEYQFIEDKSMDYEIIADHLSRDAAYIYSKGLVFQYSDAGAYMLEATGYSYRAHNEEVGRIQHTGIYDDGFIARYCPEKMPISGSFDSPCLENLKNIYFVSDGNPELAIWVSQNGGKIAKNYSKRTSIIAEKSITYTLFLACKQMGCAIYALEDVLKIIRSESGSAHDIKSVKLPSYDVKLRDEIRAIIKEYMEKEDEYAAYMGQQTYKKFADWKRRHDSYEGEYPEDVLRRMRESRFEESNFIQLYVHY